MRKISRMKYRFRYPCLPKSYISHYVNVNRTVPTLQWPEHVTSKTLSIRRSHVRFEQSSTSYTLNLLNLWANLFYRLFSVFSNKHHTLFPTNICEKYPSSIWCWYSNPQPSKQESPPITSRPGPPPLQVKLICCNLISISEEIHICKM